MKTTQWNRTMWSVVLLAVVGLVLPPSMTAQAAESSSFVDVALGPNGTLDGQLVDDSDIGVPGRMIEVTASGDQTPAAQTVTDNSGRFRLAGLRGGVYQVASTDTTQLARLWAADTAPPAADGEMLMVAGRSTVRGQDMFGSMGSLGRLTNFGMLGVSVTAVTLSAVTMSEVSRLQRKVNNLPSS
ncbi:unnamed protein product [marine sediment metagenome]|uniref:Carboxypeptidase regulatory-like domain-containing protein n=1 Tax=marine sediment metagenome TaxID=412755 RepID=X0SBS2_9ZZZZ